MPPTNGGSTNSHLSPLHHASSSATPLGTVTVLDKLPAWQRLTACLAVRAVLQPLATSAEQQRQLALLCHALMLPMLDGVGAGKRLSLVTEAAGALKSLLCDSPDNQRAAVHSGGVPVMVQLLYAHNLNIAGSAAEAISYLMNQFRWVRPAWGPRACLAVAGPRCIAPGARGCSCMHCVVRRTCTVQTPGCCFRRRQLHLPRQLLDAVCAQAGLLPRQ